jgi:hypothetical protein
MLMAICTTLWPHHDALCTFGFHAHGDLHYAVAFRSFTHGLAARHGDGVVVQNLIGDVYTRSHALANRQNATVEVGAVANVGKDVLVGAEGLLAAPWYALTTHLGEARGAAVHPEAHEVAANAGHGARAFGNFGGGVVWTA